MPSLRLSLVASALFTLSVFAHPHSDKRHHHTARATPTVYSSCVNSKDIALTFDDGPYDNLRSISDHFTAAGAKATFFWNGKYRDCIYNRVTDMQYAYNAGHLIGSHTWSHANLSALSTAQIQDEMYRVELAFSRILGIRPAFMRPPYGEYTGNVQSIAASRGQALALWDTDTEDADGETVAYSEAVYNQVVSSNAKNALILEHETVSTTASTLVPYAINLFQSHGYNLVTLATCLGVSPYQIVGVPQTQSEPQQSSWTCDNTPDPGAACGGSIPCQTGSPPAVSTSSTSTSTSTSSTPTATNQYIHLSANSGKCLGAASNSNGAAVTVQDCATTTAQAWTFTSSGQLALYGGSMCLDVTSGTVASGTKLQIWACGSGNANQVWTQSGSAFKWASHNSYCMDDTSGSTSNGNQVQIWSCTGGPNQAWGVTTGSGSTSTSTSTSTNPTSTGQTIRPNASSSTCLTVASNTDGAAVVVQPCSSGNAAQQWVQNGATLVVYGSKCLDITGGSYNDGTHLQVWSCTPGQGDAQQHWTVTSSKTIQSTGTTKCVDLTNGSLNSGNVMQIWDCSTSSTPYANQVFNFV
ncbi:Glycoside hydrolase/deacetylase [Mycena chlorophos]|uniref:Glycoside hydrolase/deacetylase n=1 Tax=Mycena chlorophos TaxID=658473 RepID=A0A8H6TQA2_MYCCL|nr:Glycoside hydrolase/deacetylase [Mycena chlorophos]